MKKIINHCLDKSIIKYEKKPLILAKTKGINFYLTNIKSFGRKNFIDNIVEFLKKLICVKIEIFILFFK